MFRVKKLPEDVVKKIAAGEVVDRPASVLKELIENSLDAGATKIDVFVEKGGKKLIQVKDNGEGIHPDDITDVINRYTTSKISSVDDLYSLDFYGFRGEALYSISSVSKLTIVSRVKDFPLGKELVVEGGRIKYVGDTGAPVGTNVKVIDLFYNIPVRQKFLKTDKTELVYIIDTFVKYALIHTDKHFNLYIDGKEKFNLSPESIEERIKRIYPRLNNLYRFSAENEVGKAEGFVSLDESLSKKGIIYINERPVKNWVLSKVLKSIFGKNFFVLFLELPPYFVDFNVHPSKQEVKLKKDAPVIELVKKASESIKTEPVKKVYTVKQEVKNYSKDVEFKVLGQIENTFLVVYLDGDVYFIDQHVAHERINYNLLRKKYLSQSIEKKKLKNALKVELSQEDKLRIEENENKLRQFFGFRVEENSLDIYEIPSFINSKDAESVFFEILESFDIKKPIEDSLAEIACKSSIKAGDLLTDKEAQSLLKTWILTDNPNLCPHGRPIYYKISLDTIKKAVGRK